MTIFSLGLICALGAAPEGQPDGAVAALIANAAPGSTVEIPAGVHRLSIKREGIRLIGAGAEETIIEVPEGEHGAVVKQSLALEKLTIRGSPNRCALRVEGGRAELKQVMLIGDSCALGVQEGTVLGEGVHLHAAMYGLLMNRGTVTLEGGTARAWTSAISVTRGKLTLRRFTIVGPAQESAVTLAGNAEANLDTVMISDPGPTGISVVYGAKLVGRHVSVTGATSAKGFLGDCIQGLRGDITLESSELRRCSGAAVEAARSKVRLRGVDAEGGEAGCLVFIENSETELHGVRCTGRGPGLVVAGGSRAKLSMNRWLADPAFFVECDTGARVTIEYGEQLREPCPAKPAK